MTFGIPTHVISVLDSGEISLENHKGWLEQRQKIETIQDESPNVISLPKQNDVLLGREKMMQTHPGNIRYQNLVASLWDEYNGAQKLRKTEIANSIVDSVLDSGGHFLKLDNGYWVEVDKLTARLKVSNAFRDKRKTKQRENISMKEKLRRDFGELDELSFSTDLSDANDDKAKLKRLRFDKIA